MTGRLLSMIAAALLAQSALTVTAEAAPRHRHHHVAKHHAAEHYAHRVSRVRHYRHVRRVEARQPQTFFEGFQSSFDSGYGGSTALVSRARQYLGATARQVGVRTTLWCSAFVRKLTNARGVDDRALSWEGKRRIAPQVGAIVTMNRRGGGHVGVVSGFTSKGDPIVISGNHRNRVAESVYPRSRIRAWLSPS